MAPLIAYVWDLQYMYFHDNGELVQCCMYTIDAGKEVDRPSLNANRASIRGKTSQITL